MLTKFRSSISLLSINRTNRDSATSEGPQNPPRRQHTLILLDILEHLWILPGGPALKAQACLMESTFIPIQTITTRRRLFNSVVFLLYVSLRILLVKLITPGKWRYFSPNLYASRRGFRLS